MHAFGSRFKLGRRAPRGSNSQFGLAQVQRQIFRPKRASKLENASGRKTLEAVNRGGLCAAQGVKRRGTRKSEPATAVRRRTGAGVDRRKRPSKQSSDDGCAVLNSAARQPPRSRIMAAHERQGGFDGYAARARGYAARRPLQRQGLQSRQAEGRRWRLSDRLYELSLDAKQEKRARSGARTS